MPSFKSILFFAAAALATFTFAAPSANSGVAAVDIVARDIVPAPVEIVERTLTTFPAIIADVTVQVNVVVANLNAYLAAHAIVDVNVLLGFIADVKAILIVAIAEINAIVDVSADALLFNGTVIITVCACAQLLYALFVIIIVFLYTCYTHAGLLGIVLVLAAIIDFCLTLVVFLVAFFDLLVGLKICFAALLDADVYIKGLINILGLTAIITLFAGLVVF